MNRTHPRPFATNLSAAGDAAAWAEFPERNLGIVVLATARPLVSRLLERFYTEFVLEIRGYARGDFYVRGDQTAFRAALFGMRHEVRDA